MFERIFHVVLIIFIVCFVVAVGYGVVMMVKAGVINEENRITSGVVIDKEFDAGYTSTSGSKETGISIHSYPATYMLLIEGRKDGYTVQYWKEVTAEEYAAYDIGDYYGK